jgi:UDP-N-acetyl-D-glucosamine dehydrogenase
VRKLGEVLNDHGRAIKGSKVLVVGVAYKRDIDDLRESPALDIIKLLEQQGAHVEFHDPHVASYLEDGKTVHSVPLTAERLKAADCVMVVTDHTAMDYGLVKKHARLVVDTRHVMPRD